MNGKLTTKQQRFVDEYVIDFNATQAAIRSGYSAKTALQQGSRLLINVDIQQAIAKRIQKLSDKCEITQERVLAEYARIAFSDMRNFAEWGADGVTLLESSDLANGDAACVAEVSQSVTAKGETLKFKLHSKTAALDGICNMLGYKAPEKTELTGANGGPIEIGDSAMCKARINELIAKRGN